MTSSPGQTTRLAPPERAGRQLRVGFVANRYMDPRRIGSWSGIPYHFARCLAAAGCEIVPIYDLEEPPLFLRKVRQAFLEVRPRETLPARRGAGRAARLCA